MAKIEQGITLKIGPNNGIIFVMVIIKAINVAYLILNNVARARPNAPTIKEQIALPDKN